MPGEIKKHLSVAQKLAVYKCYKEFAALHLARSTIIIKLMNIFNISETTIRKILFKKEQGLELGNKKPEGRPKSREFDDFIFKEEISHKIFQLHDNSEFFTIQDLLDFARQNLDFQRSKSTFVKILKSMGYAYKVADGRKVLVEQPHLIAKKIRFLRRYLQLLKLSETEPICFVYLDETWIYQNGSHVRLWIHKTDLRGMPKAKRFRGEGKRFTILHAGCASGFLPQCNFFLDSKIEHRDYHKTMTGEVFMKWVGEQLIPAVGSLDGKVVVVMDNAPYHSMKIDKPPTSNSKKAIMQQWLTVHNITFEEDFTKKQLYDLIIRPFSTNQNYIKYEVDELLERNGCEVLRLPPYHCQYNPIELAWSFCKNYYNKHINSRPSSKDRVANLWLEALSLCTQEKWMNFIQHCEKIIKNDWIRCMGNCSVDDIPPFIINLESDSDLSAFDSDSDSASAASVVVTDESDVEEDSELITIIVVSDDENECLE